MSEDRFVTVATLDDPVQADMYRDLLSQSGIPVMTPGSMHRSMLGVLGSYVVIPIQVPELRAAEAAALLAAMADEGAVVVDDSPGMSDLGSSGRDADDGALAPGDGPYRRALQRTTAESPRLKRVAAFLALTVTFGSAHFYVREHVSGALLLFAELGALGLSTSWPSLIGGVPVLVLVDLVGAVRAADRYNEGKPLSALAQLGRTGASIFFALALAALAGTLLAISSGSSIPAE